MISATRPGSEDGVDRVDVHVRLTFRSGYRENSFWRTDSTFPNAGELGEIELIRGPAAAPRGLHGMHAYSSTLFAPPATGVVTARYGGRCRSST